MLVRRNQGSVVLDALSLRYAGTNSASIQSMQQSAFARLRRIAVALPTQDIRTSLQNLRC